MSIGGTTGRIARCEVLATLSLATDLGMGQPMEHGLRTCLLALALGAEAELEPADMATLYDLALLRWIGCTAHAHEVSELFGDEISAQGRAATMDFGSVFELAGDLVRHAGEDRAALQRLGVVVQALVGGPAAINTLFEASCEVAANLSVNLGVEPSVVAALEFVFARWDGKGPPGFGGEAVPVTARLLHIAQDAAVFHRVGGSELARRVVRKRTGSSYDPELADLFLAHATELLSSVEQPSLWTAVLAADPREREPLDEATVDASLVAIADFVDMKTRFTLNHSRGVATLAAAAASDLGLPASDVRLLRRAALVHDIGASGVANSVWEKRGTLSDSEFEQVRLHTYLTERLLARSDGLRPLGDIAAHHHERLDGSGYHRGSTTREIPATARLLATADVYHALLEDRPHRARLTPADAARQLRAEAKAGRLDPEAVQSVLRAAGERTRGAPRGFPAGLTSREVEVLALVARGHTTRQVADELGIARKSADHHIQHIYDKIGVRSRAAATLFAAQHGLAGRVIE